VKYIKILDGIPKQYTLSDLFKDNKNVSFPDNINDDLLSDYNVFPLIETQKPLGDVVVEGLPKFEDGHWIQTWVIRDYTEEEIQQNLNQKRQNMVVTMRQARLALRQVNMLNFVEDGLNMLPEPDRTDAKIEWEYAQEVERLRPFVLTLQPLLGLTDEQLDYLFELAKTL
jgi:hypothetical protein